MAGLKEVRVRIASVESTKQITNAMKMVSASKLRRAQNAIIKLRPYEAKMREILNHIQSKVEELPEADYAKKRDVKKALLVVITSNKGLCGNFNSSIIKEALLTINTTFSELNKEGNLYILTIGRKGTDYFRKRKFNVIADYDGIFQALSYEKTEPISRMLMDKFINMEYDAIHLIYNRFKNASSQLISNETFLPIEPDTSTEIKKKSKTSVDYIYEPDKIQIISDLIPKILKLRFHRALLDSYAAEHGARMTAMHKATDNATELIKNLKLYYNKVRQASITKEILEIVSGAEALNG